MKKGSWVIWAIIAWLVFVVSLSLWWMIFSLRLLGRLTAILPSEEARHHQNMLILEGSTLILFLIVGGITLIYFALREKRRFEEVRHFFSSFSHDLKTSITRLVLQGEQLFSKEKSSEPVRNFQKNLLALEMQLENSLHLAQQDNRQLILQPLELKALMSRLHGHWPQIKFNLQGKAPINADAVALESIIKNLVSNSVLHGGADEISIQVTSDEHRVQVDYRDNGGPFNGDWNKLGSAPSPSSKGTGLGLFIVQQWAQKLNCKIQFNPSETGSLQVRLLFSSARKI